MLIANIISVEKVKHYKYKHNNYITAVAWCFSSNKLVITQNATLLRFILHWMTYIVPVIIQLWVTTLVWKNFIFLYKHCSIIVSIWLAEFCWLFPKKYVFGLVSTKKIYQYVFVKSSCLTYTILYVYVLETCYTVSK